jgi:gliding motility-associated-like protein
MHSSLKNILILISLSFFSIVKAQIYSRSAIGYPTEYTISGKADSIFVFSIDNLPGSIMVQSPDSTEVNFKWSVYQSGTGEYHQFADTNAITLHIDTITSNRGYQVIIPGVDTFRCWVLIYDFDVVITSTVNHTILNGDINCRTISYIKAQITDNELFYYNPLTNEQKEYKPKNSTLWSCNPKEAELPTPKTSLQVSVEDPYWKDTWYIVTVTNKDTKQKKSDSAYYKSVRPHAEFGEPALTVEYIPLDDSSEYPHDPDDPYFIIYNHATYNKKSAPAKYRLINNSKNADEYTWIFGDDSTEVKHDTTPVIHQYELPGTYYAYLVAKKNVDFLYDPCYDTFPRIESDTNKILVDQVQSVDTSQVPNVFTSKQRWRFKEDVSITDFEIAIFNRFGDKVYHFKGNIRDWPGWNGERNGKRVSTGVYFFVVKKIKALPDYETEKLPEELVLVKKGFVHFYDIGD